MLDNSHSGWNSIQIQIIYLATKYLKNDKVNNKNTMIVILRMMILNYK